MRIVLIVIGLLAACRPPQALDVTPASAGLTLPEGFSAEVLATGLQGPTQMILGPDGALWVAQLAGEELVSDFGTGTIYRVTER